MRENLKPLVVFALLGPLAFFVGGQVYEQVIVPRLPGVQRVPLWWWSGQFLWPVLVFAAAGWFARSFAIALSLSAVAFFPLYLASIAADIVRGEPVGHDLSAASPAFWAAVLLQFALWYAVAAGVHAVRRLLDTQRAAA